LDDELKSLAEAGDKIDHFATLSMLLQIEQLVGQGLLGSSSQKKPLRSKAVAASDTDDGDEKKGDEEEDDDDSVTSPTAAAASKIPGLSALFTSLQMHLHLLFNSFIDDQCKWIDEYRCSVKQAGVLAPIAKFPAFVDRMESVVRAVRVAGEQRSSIVDSAYHKLAQSLFRWLEASAKSDEKYTDVALMENYQFFWLAFTHRQPTIVALSHHQGIAQELYLARMEAYVKWTLTYEDVLPEAFKFFDQLEDALKSVAAEDVQFSNGLRKTDLRELCKNTLNSKYVQKAMNNAAKRVSKHLPKNEGLARQVWMSVEAHFRTRFKRFQQLVAQCYQSEKLTLSWQDVQAVLQQVSQESHFDAQSNVSDH
jgi:hypothetical protein